LEPRPRAVRLLIPLLYWLEADRLRNLPISTPINPGPGQADLTTTAPIGFVDQDVAAMRALFATFLARTHNGQQSIYGNTLSKMMRQIGRLLDVVALQFNTPDMVARNAELARLPPEYVGESSPSEIAAALATTPEPIVPNGLRIDWRSLWPTI
jgi:hypothetical protein